MKLKCWKKQGEGRWEHKKDGSMYVKIETREIPGYGIKKFLVFKPNGWGKTEELYFGSSIKKARAEAKSYMEKHDKEC